MTAIGIDFDGTIADTNRVKARWVHEHMGQDIDPARCDRTSCVPLIGVEAYETMSAVVYERAWTLRTPPVQGALEALRGLARRCEVHIVTARPPRRAEFARQWLEAHGVMDCIAAIVSAADREKAAVCRERGMVALIDDDRRHLLALAGGPIQAVHFGRAPQDEAVRCPALAACGSWPEVLAVLSGPDGGT